MRREWRALPEDAAADAGRGAEISNAWFEFGFSCTILGQYETEQEEQHIGNAFAKLGNCADRLSVLITQKARAARRVRTLAEPLRAGGHADHPFGRAIR